MIYNFAWVNKSPLLFPILSHWIMYHLSYSVFLEVRFNIISFTLRSSNGLFSFGFSYRNFSSLCHACYMLRPFTHSWTDHHSRQRLWIVYLVILRFSASLVGLKFILSTVTSQHPQTGNLPLCVLLFMTRMAVASDMETTYAGEATFSLEVRK